MNAKRDDEFTPPIVIEVDHIVVRDRLRPVLPDGARITADWMTKSGIGTPIIVRPDPQIAGRYLLVAGGHRLAGAKLLHWQTIPAMVVDGLDDDAARLIEIEENLHRHELDVVQRSEHDTLWMTLTQKSISAQAAPKVRGRPEGGVRAAARNIGISRDRAARSSRIAGLSREAKREAVALGLANNQSALLRAADEEEPTKQVNALQNANKKAAARAANAAAEVVLTVLTSPGETIARDEEIRLLKHEVDSCNAVIAQRDDELRRAREEIYRLKQQNDDLVFRIRSLEGHRLPSTAPAEDKGAAPMVAPLPVTKAGELQPAARDEDVKTAGRLHPQAATYAKANGLLGNEALLNIVRRYGTLAGQIAALEQAAASQVSQAAHSLPEAHFQLPARVASSAQAGKPDGGTPTGTPVKRGRGRPPGSKNKPKEIPAAETTAPLNDSGDLVAV